MEAVLDPLTASPGTRRELHFPCPPHRPALGQPGIFGHLYGDIVLPGQLQSAPARQQREFKSLILPRPAFHLPCFPITASVGGMLLLFPLCRGQN